ncbi:hypothetical protein [Variovorax sp. HJSM1_2]|uniref:hypothetical protein n=1 Tax=Variovorax sp. HJSM1_2 TaxID=3366263 RepID=UPI003BEAA278
MCAAITVMAALASPALAATVDVTQGNVYSPAGTLDLKTGDEAAQEAANAAAAAHGITEAMSTPRPATANKPSNSSTPTSPASKETASAATPAKPVDLDLGRAVRDATKPLREELARSAVGEAVRGLATDDQIDEGTTGDEAAGRRRSWEGPQGSSELENGGRPRTEAEMASDKVKVAFLLQALLHEVAPWVVAAGVLYVLFYTLRLLLAFRRRSKAEKRERRRQHERRRSQAPASSRGTPTQH